MIVRLEQISSTHDNIAVEDRHVIGYVSNPPVLGDSVVLYFTKNNDSAYLRTSPVQASIRTTSGKWSFHTKNSHYEMTEINSSDFNDAFNNK